MNEVARLLWLAMTRGYVRPNAVPGYVFVTRADDLSVAFPARKRRAAS